MVFWQSFSTKKINRVMAKEISTSISLGDGDPQICILKEKVDNENGKLLYRFRNQNSGEEYLIIQHGDSWQGLNGCQLPEAAIKQLGEFVGHLSE